MVYENPWYQPVEWKVTKTTGTGETVDMPATPGDSAFKPLDWSAEFPKTYVKSNVFLKNTIDDSPVRVVSKVSVYGNNMRSIGVRRNGVWVYFKRAYYAEVPHKILAAEIGGMVLRTLTMILADYKRLIYETTAGPVNEGCFLLMAFNKRTDALAGMTDATVAKTVANYASLGIDKAHRVPHLMQHHFLPIIQFIDPSDDESRDAIVDRMVAEGFIVSLSEKEAMHRGLKRIHELLLTHRETGEAYSLRQSA